MNISLYFSLEGILFFAKNIINKGTATKFAAATVGRQPKQRAPQSAPAAASSIFLLSVIFVKTAEELSMNILTFWQKEEEKQLV